jgi:hypothetical protein
MQAERNVLTPMVGAVGKRRSHAAWWKKIFRPAAAMAGLIVAGADAKAAPVAVESGEYRPATTVPETWQVFARQLQQTFEQQLAGDSDGAHRIHDYLMRRGGAADAPALKLALRAWVSADGRVSRIEVDGMDDVGMRAELRALLMVRGAGAPPPEMLQPLHLRLSLRTKDRSREGK